MCIRDRVVGPVEPGRACVQGEMVVGRHDIARPHVADVVPIQQRENAGFQFHQGGFHGPREGEAGTGADAGEPSTGMTGEQERDLAMGGVQGLDGYRESRQTDGLDTALEDTCLLYTACPTAICGRASSRRPTATA